MQAVSEGSRRAGIVGWLLLVALLAWIVSVARMWGMDAGPGTDLGALISFLGIWVTMMAAMMLPAVVPVVALFVRVHRSVRPVLFVGGYLVVWAAYGLAAHGLFRAARRPRRPSSLGVSGGRGSPVRALWSPGSTR